MIIFIGHWQRLYSKGHQTEAESKHEYEFLRKQYHMLQAGIRDVRIHDNSIHIWCDLMGMAW